MLDPTRSSRRLVPSSRLANSIPIRICHVNPTRQHDNISSSSISSVRSFHRVSATPKNDTYLQQYRISTMPQKNNVLGSVDLLCFLLCRPVLLCSTLFFPDLCCSLLFDSICFVMFCRCPVSSPSVLLLSFIFYSVLFCSNL